MNEKTKNLLIQIAKSADSVISLLIDVQKKRIYPSQASYYKALFRLEKKGLITKIKKGKRNSYFLTSEGKRLLRNPTQKKERRDGLSTIIIFDIPEEKARERTIFRRYLQRNGYTILQRSVLVAPFDISDDTKQLINELKIRSHISVIDGKINYL